MDGKIKPIIIGVVLIILSLTVIGSLASTVDSAADDITQDQRCAAVGCYFNETGVLTTTDCFTNFESNVTCTNSLATKTYPLETLFNTGGIVILLFMAAALVFTVGIVLPMFKKK